MLAFIRAFFFSDGRPIVNQTIRPDTITIFSKTYCGYSDSSKELLSSLVPAGKITVVELDNHPEGSAIQKALGVMTNQTSVPSIWIGKEHIGGNSDLERIHYKEKRLIGKLQNAGIL